jgi:hypothetical protein
MLHHSSVRDLRRWLFAGFLSFRCWLLVLISLLASTADTFFVPSLQYLSVKLRLSPSVAGITLLAIVCYFFFMLFVLLDPLYVMAEFACAS